MQNKILVVEDQVMVQHALCSLIGQCDDFHPVGCNSKAEALALIEENGPYDLVLLDLRLPDAQNVTDHSEIIAANDGKPVALLSANASRADVSIALKMGMKGYLSKSMHAKALLDAVRDLLDGQHYISGYKGDAGDAPEVPNAERLMETLTEIEKRILDLMKLGMSNAQISGELRVRQNQIAKNVSDIYRKIGVRTRLQAVTLMHI
jgi:two-component system nitrate/nitrite response regulator NarL